jgi:polysaccharide export outer membrane protein
MRIRTLVYESFKRAAMPITLAGFMQVATVNTSAQFLGAPPSESHPSSATSASTQSPEGGAASTILPGDSFEIQIFNVPQYDYKGRVDDDGAVTLPLVGKVQLGGQTIAAAEQTIAGKLVDAKIIKAPQVFLHITESPNRTVTVSGEVKSPGPVPIYGEKRLLDILSAAGGLTPLSSPVLTIYRRASPTPFQIELPADPAALGSNNIAMLPGDSVIVAKLGVVYVLGAFHQQGALPLRNNSQLTLIEALSLAGGVNYEAALKKAFILRSTAGGRVEIPFDVSALMKHRIPDQPLQNEDIILIPTNNMKAALKGGAAGVAASLLAGIGYITIK